MNNIIGFGQRTGKGRVGEVGLERLGDPIVHTSLLLNPRRSDLVGHIKDIKHLGS